MTTSPPEFLNGVKSAADSTDTSAPEVTGMSRRHLLRGGAISIAAAGLGVSVASAENIPPTDPLRTNSKTGVRTAIITDTQLNIGPVLALKMATLGYNLVIADVRKGLVEELKRLGANQVVTVEGLEQEGPNNESKPGSIQKLVDAAMDRFGGYDSVFIRTAWHGGKPTLEETLDNMESSFQQNCLAPMYAFQAVIPPLVEMGGGQVVLQTSATGAKPYSGMMSYSVMRAAANMMGRCVAMDVADKNVCVNVIGTNFMNYPDFMKHSGAEKNPDIYKAILNEIPSHRLGETKEAAHLALSVLDGHNMYTTGNFFPVAGGYNHTGMK
ncbi:MAG TPA: SDR family oxidoreductase [Porticoccus sp.]|nr:SDR family oxidoreductase [Porticoccus sp.]